MTPRPPTYTLFPYTTLFRSQDNGGTDNGGVDTDQSANTITFNVTSVNDAPAGADKTDSNSTRPNSTLVETAYAVSCLNESPTNAIAAVKITTLAGTVTLTDT